jgi:hypothetical protein
MSAKIWQAAGLTALNSFPHPQPRPPQQRATIGMLRKQAAMSELLTALLDDCGYRNLEFGETNG